MKDYSPKERALLDAARKGWGPSESLMRDVRAGVPDRLEADPDLSLAAPGPVNAVTSVGRLEALKAFARGPWAAATGLAVVGLCSVFGTVLVQEKTHSSPRVAPSALDATPLVESPVAAAPQATPPVEVSPPPVETVSLDSLPEAPAEKGAKAKASPPRATTERPNAAHDAPSPDVDSLAEEVTLVRAARKALRDGHPAQALASLSTHATRFPQGVLREERMTLQVLSLCEMGDIAEARRMRAELVRIAPSSSHLERLSCAAQ